MKTYIEVNTSFETKWLILNTLPTQEGGRGGLGGEGGGGGGVRGRGGGGRGGER